MPVNGHSSFVHLRLYQIVSEGNVRKHFDEAKLQELAESIRENGIIEPLIVRAEDDAPDFENDLFQLIAGERRLRAAKIAGLDKVPVRVMYIDKKQAAKLQLIENIQREDLNAIEEAQAYKTLLDKHDYTQEKLAAELGVSQAHVANRIRLLELPEDVQVNISREIISPSHGRVLAGFKKLPERMLKIAVETIAEKGVPVAETPKAVMKIIAEEGKPLFNDYNNKPEFNTSQCEKCEYRVMGNRWGGFSEEPYCVKPSCWEKKQQEVRRDRELALADRVQKAAQKGNGVVELDKFQYDQYEEFSDYKIDGMDLSECQECEHRKVAKKSYSDELTEACFQPSCFKKKQAAATREKNKIARDAFNEELQKISELVNSLVSYRYPIVQDGTVILDRQALIYLAAQVLASVDQSNDRKITVYKYLKDKFGWDHDVLKRGAWGMMHYEWETFLSLLTSLDERQLLRVVFEWPAVARGLEGAEGWFLNHTPDNVPLTAPEEPEEDNQHPAVVTPEPKRYLDDQGRELFVSTGLGDEFGTFWRSTSGGLHRVKSPSMPMVPTREEAQANLDAYAEKKVLKLVTVEPNEVVLAVLEMDDADPDWKEALEGLTDDELQQAIERETRPSAKSKLRAEARRREKETA
jgi:ParB/RepB/Spo0J family partition protein